MRTADQPFSSVIDRLGGVRGCHSKTDISGIRTEAKTDHRAERRRDILQKSSFGKIFGKDVSWDSCIRSSTERVVGNDLTEDGVP